MSRRSTRVVENLWPWSRRKAHPLRWGLWGAALGASAMYWGDPRSGRRRRATLEGKATHAAREASWALERAVKDASHRAGGWAHEMSERFKDEPVADETLAERVRSALGRATRHPSKVRVRCKDGEVQLNGTLGPREQARVVAQVRRVRGVRAVKDQLVVQRDVARAPVRVATEARRRRGRRWTPSGRMGGVLLGAALVGRGLRRGGWEGAATLGVGALLAARAATNLPWRRLTGVGAGPTAVSVSKNISVRAPVEEVYAFFETLENFPRFMSHVDEVQRLDKERTRWRITGPAGLHFEWTATTTRRVPNEVIAWRSLEGASVENAGVIQFESQGPRATRLNIRLVYNPPAGALGHAFAALLGADVKRMLDDDLVRFKSLLEDGKVTEAGRTVSLEDLDAQPRVPDSRH